MLLPAISVNTEIKEGDERRGMPNARYPVPFARTAMLEKLPDLIGHALRGQRAGLDKTAFHAVDLRGGMAALSVAACASPTTRRFPSATPPTARASRRRCSGPACPKPPRRCC
jgi:hypothetical protein